MAEAQVWQEDGYVDISPDQDGGLLKKVLEEGRGEETPNQGDEVKAHYVGTLFEGGDKFDSSRDRDQPFTFTCGVGQVIKAWDIAFANMKRGEKAVIRARHDYAYGEAGRPPTIPPSAALVFEVELLSWKEKVKEPYEMSAEERSAFAQQKKDMGTAAFKEGDWVLAFETYDEGARYLEFEAEELGPEGKTLAIALHTNSAMAKLKASEFEEAKSSCDKALEYDPANAKALFRRAKAKFSLGEHDLAIEDAEKLLEVDPSNKEAETLKKQAEAEKRRAKQKEKAMCAKMFG